MNFSAEKISVGFDSIFFYCYQIYYTKKSFLLKLLPSSMIPSGEFFNVKIHLFTLFFQIFVNLVISTHFSDYGNNQQPNFTNPLFDAHKLFTVIETWLLKKIISYRINTFIYFKLRSKVNAYQRTTQHVITFATIIILQQIHRTSVYLCAKLGKMGQLTEVSTFTDEHGVLQ